MLLIPTDDRLIHKTIFEYKKRDDETKKHKIIEKIVFNSTLKKIILQVNEVVKASIGKKQSKQNQKKNYCKNIFFVISSE